MVSSSDFGAQRDPAKEKLIRFLQRHPEASDTIEGIARWWVHMPEESVAHALEGLVQAGVLEKVERLDSVLYRANQLPSTNGY